MPVGVPINSTRHSPNFSSRHGAAVSMLVYHASGGTLASALAWLTSPASRVSSHFAIGKTGVIYQLVANDQAAWHAGASIWLGLDAQAIQDCSIGIELANADDGIDPYPAAQIAAAVALGRELIARYQIEPRMVVRHRDIAQPPGRKHDPENNFPWESFKVAVFAGSWPRNYIALTCAPIFCWRAPDAKLAGSRPAGAVISMGQLEAGYLWEAGGWGFSPVSCWEPE